MGLDKPKISVIIVCYNNGSYIKEAIESVLNQTLSPFEIIICDDHSTDNSWDIIKDYEKRYPGLIKAFRHDKNKGISANINFGLKKAKGDLVTSLAGDDRFLPKKLEIEWKTLLKNPEAKLAYSNVIIINSEGEKVGVWDNGKGFTPPSGDVFIETFSRKFFPNSRSLFRNELIYRYILEEVGYYDESLEMYEDWDIRIRITSKFKVIYTGEPLIEYRIHEGGIHKSRPEKHIKAIKRAYTKNIPLLSRCTKIESLFIKECIENYINSHLFQLIINRKKKANRILDRNLIFIISQPRAGSTLLQRILGGHPEIYTIAEPWIMLHPIYALKDHGYSAQYDAKLAHEALEDFCKSLPHGKNSYIEAIRRFALSLYEEVLSYSGKDMFLDKTPRYYYIIPELYSLFPNAHFIILFRNPLSVLSSILNSWVKNNWRYLYSHKDDLFLAPKLLVEGVKYLKDKAIVIHYENLVNNPEDTISYICKKIGIRFYPEMIEYGSKEAPKGRFGDNINIKRHTHPVTDYCNVWIEKMTSPAYRFLARFYLSFLGPKLLSEMGYSFENLQNSLLLIKDGREMLREDSISSLLAYLGL